MHSTGHPLARELRFQIILFSLRVLRYATVVSGIGQCRLKDQILSATLSWFAFAPRFSFGGNRLQLKAETRLLSDVDLGLKNVKFMVPEEPASLKRLRDKEELLFALLENEQSRLKVWLYPLGDVKDQYVHNVQLSEPSEAVGLRLVKTAWAVSPSLAIHLTTRFHSPKLHREVRNHVLNYPSKAIDEPEALSVLISGILPSDVTWQLKVSFML
jgi:phosphatidylinositol 4-kinase A